MMTNTMTPEQLKAAVRARRERLVRFHMAYLFELGEAAPTWLDLVDDMHEVIYDPQACELLAETAPDDGYLRGYWMGRAAALHSISALIVRSVDC